MANVEKPEDWTEEQFAAYFGTEDDPIEDEAVLEYPDIVDVPEINDDEALGDDGSGSE